MAQEQNNLVTREELEVFAEQVNESCPVIADASNVGRTQDGSYDIKGRSGGKVTLVLPDPGTTVVTHGKLAKIGAGGDITDTSIQEFERTFTIACATNACSLNAIEETTSIDDFEREISGPRCRSVGAGIERDFIGYDGFAVSDSGFVVDGTAAGFDGWELLSNLAGNLDDAMVGGDIVGYMSGSIKSKITANTKNRFNAPTTADEIHRKAQIGEYANVDWKKTQMPIVEVKAAAPTAITAVNGAAGTITVTCASGARYPKGYAFKVNGVFLRDINKNVTGVEKVFVLQEDCVASGTSAVLKVGPFSATDAHANVSKLPTTSDSIVGMMTNGKNYAVVWAVAKNNLTFKPVKLVSSGLQEVSAQSSNGKIIMSAVVKGDDNREALYRFDSAFIGGAIDSRRAAVGYIQL